MVGGLASFLLLRLSAAMELTFPFDSILEWFLFSKLLKFDSPHPTFCYVARENNSRKISTSSPSRASKSSIFRVFYFFSAVNFYLFLNKQKKIFLVILIGTFFFPPFKSENMSIFLRGQ